MSKREQLPESTGPLSPAHQPDEGYCEDVLDSGHLPGNLSSLLASVRSPADLPPWITQNGSLLPISVKAQLAMAVLDQLPTSVIVEIIERLSPRLYIDFIRHLPAEICLKILGYLDLISLVSVLRTCRAWYDLALDRKLWENLYHLEGWKAIASEIEACEARVNIGINMSLGQLRRAHMMPDGHTSKLRGNMKDVDSVMTNDDQHPAPQDTARIGSMFGSVGSQYDCNYSSLSPSGEMNLDHLSKGKGIDRGFGLLEGRPKRKEPGGTPEAVLPSIMQTDDLSLMLKSSLWAWDIHNSRYRANWKHLYNMRRRLESNWELGKYTTFVLPHPGHPEEGHRECVYTLQFDANYLVSGSRDRTMRVWNMRTRRLARPPLEGHLGSVLCLQFDADPLEDILVSGSSDTDIFIWKFSTGEIIQKIDQAHREAVLNVRFDKRILVTSSKDKTIKIFNRRPVSDCRMAYHADQAVDPVGRTVKAYGYEPDLSLEVPLSPPYTMIGKLEGHGAAVNAIQVRGRTIVSVSGDRQIKLWNWPEQVCVQTIPAHEKGIACVEFDERRIVSGSSDYDVCIFDALTGLRVASLRGHAHLVRTVQAGFADLPDSKMEDRLEAKRVDDEYFRAVEAGEIDHESEGRFRRERATNPGSSRPADLQAYGAKVPPGGGGGRKYGRIVSGSYDQTIIIWRRDKEGVWKPAHHLRQEEAAEAAYRKTAMASVQQSNAQLALDHITLQPAHYTSPQGVLALPSPFLHHHYAHAADFSRAIIDQAVPMGVTALRQALSTHPGILIHHSHLQSMIEKEPSPIVRGQMRQAVADALISIQNSQSSRQRAMPAMRAGATNTPAAPSRLSKATRGSPGSPTFSNPPVSATTSGSGGPSGSGSSNSVSNNRQVFSPLCQMAEGAEQPIAAPAPAPMFSPLSRLPQQIQPQAMSSMMTSGQQPQPPRQNPDNARVVGQAPPPHPRFAAADYAPARVFKLQFDARKIICCTHAPIIVGWDFCNGDPELEESARFFATID